MTRPSTRRHDGTALPDGSTDGGGRTARRFRSSDAAPFVDADAFADRDAGRRTTRRVVAVAFWTAVVLPAVHLPLLALGPVTGDRALVVVALVALNVLALAVGHPYGRDGPAGG